MTTAAPARKLLSEERIELEIKHRTHFAKSYAQRAEKNIDEFRRDARRPDRMKAHECKTCFYLRASRVGASVPTEVACRICGEAMLFGTAVTTEICEKCGREHSACRMCLADVELRLPGAAPRGSQRA